MVPGDNHIQVIAEPADDAMTVSETMKRVNVRHVAHVNRLEVTGSFIKLK